jgi:glycosidase
MTDDVSPDFVFGTLATDELRLAQVRVAAIGFHHGHDLEPLDPDPAVPVVLRATLGPAVVADHVTAYVTTDGRDPAGDHGVATVGTAIPFERVGLRWDTLTWGYQETWQGTVPGQPDGTLVRYRLEAWSSTTGASTWASEIAGVVAGRRPPGVSDTDAATFAFATDLWPIRRRAADAYHVDRERVPDWLRDAVIYQVFVDRFATTDGGPFATPATPGGFYGGTLRGVIERLDYLEDLGVSCLWLSPVFPSPSHHGYDATDYRSIEPRLGTEADLRELVDEAHQRGLRVILDFVVNHVSSGHPAFQAAIRDRDTPEASWFTFTDWPTEYLSFFGVLDHPQIDSDDPGAQAEMVDAARHWLGLGVDGFRCDYAQGPSHAFWSVFRAATRAARPDSVTIGEIVETPALQRTYAGRLDGCLDFLLMQGLRGTFGVGTLAPSALEAFVRDHLAFFAPDFVLPSFLDNHDMNRFLWLTRGDSRRLRLAALYQATLPHPPIVYYGTEVGVTQVRDVRSADGSGHPEESRLPMRWGDDQDAGLLAFYRASIRLRRASPARWRGERTVRLADDAAGLLVVEIGQADGYGALVVVHPGEGVVTVPASLVDGRSVALTTDDGVTLGGDGLRLGPWSGAVLLDAGQAAEPGV